MKDKKMPNWLITQVELIKTLGGYEKKRSRKKGRVIDYVAEDDKKKKLLRAILNTNSKKRKVGFKTIQEIIVSIEEKGYKEALIVSDNFTVEAKNLIKETEKLDYISKDTYNPYTVIDTLHVIQIKTRELCKSICDKTPKTEKDYLGCHKQGYVKHYTCLVRMISDDSDFHAERGWIDLLYNDIAKLVKIKKDGSEQEEL